MADQLSNDLASLRIRRDENPELKNQGRNRALLVLLLLGLLALGGVGAKAVSPRIFKTEVDLTEIRMLTPAQASAQVTSTGYVVAQVQSKVAAKLFGRVAEVLVKEGQMVQAGDVLARLEDSEQRSAILAARARVSAAQARALTAEATHAEAKGQLEREQKLAGSGASARSVSDDLTLRVKGLEAATRAAQADLSAARAELQQLETNLTLMEVKAPMNGVVMARPIGVGELVGPTALLPVAELADFSSLLVEVDVPETRLSLIRIGGPTEIVLDAYPTERLRGEVVEISPKVNRQKATVVAKVRILDAQDKVLPDMSARVSFLEGALDSEAVKEPPKLFVPGNAVVERGGEKVVFRLDDDHVVLEKVTLGAPLASGFELLEGPADGTKVVASPPDTLADGLPVKERNP